MKRTLYLFVFYFINFWAYPQSSNKIVHITGLFPNVEGGRVFMYHYIDTPLINGKFNFFLDSISEGQYYIAVTYPWANGFTIRYRDKNGNIAIERRKGYTRISLGEYFYINPEQALEYHIVPFANLTPEKIKNFSDEDNSVIEKKRLRIVSNSKDGDLFKKFQELDIDYNKKSYDHIVDSLYKQSNIPNKIISDFYKDALNLNFENNYLFYSKAVQKLIKQSLTNPVSALTILNMPSDWLQMEKKRYEELLKSMSGRAVKSDYYKRVLLKLKNTKDILNEGSIFPYPVGKTPDMELLKYKFSDYKYTLVEFWASWCRPCRADNPKWNDILTKYKDSGFQILGISIDESLADWRTAIRNDKLINWLHVSDLHGAFNGVNALQYGIHEVPFNVLIDSTGKILKKEITAQELESILRK